jgi:catechol 2,3-dioxygenase-like lactoylglutathione lyase family enzyme
MIDHVSVAVRDLAAATRFYEAVLGPLGFTKLEARAATVGFGKTYPEFWINLRREMAPVAADSGAHVCFRARSTDLVDAFHAAALAVGGRRIAQGAGQELAEEVAEADAGTCHAEAGETSADSFADDRIH